MIGSKKKERIRIFFFQPLIFNGGKPSLFVFWGINQRHQHHHLRIPGWWHQLWWFSASCISRRFLNLAEIIFWEGDQTNQKSDTFFGGGFEGFFFFSIFSLDKMIKNWRAYFSNDFWNHQLSTVFFPRPAKALWKFLSNETKGPWVV